MAIARSSRGDLGRKAMFALVASLVILVPSLVWPGRPDVASYKPLLIQAAALGLLVLMTTRASWSRESLARFVRTGPNLPILLFLAWGLISYLGSPHKAYGLQVLLQLAGGAVIYFALTYRLSARRDLQKLVGGLIATVVLSVLLGCVLFAQSPGGRIASAFGNSQLFASFLVVMLPLLLVASQADDNGARRSAAQFGMILAVAALLLTQNRSAWLGAVVGLVILGILAAKNATGNRGLARHRHQILVPGLVIVGAIALFFVFSGSFASFLERASSLQSTGTDKTWAWRLDMWKAAWTMWLKSPLEGWGLGSFPLFANYLGAPSLPMAPTRMPSMGEMAHNQYVTLLAETGLIGFLLYASILVGFFTWCGRALRETTSHTRKWILMGTMAAIGAQMVDAFANPAWQFAEVNLFFWLMLGLGVAASRPRAEREAEERVTAPQPAAAWRPSRVGLALAQLALVGCVVFATTRAYAENGGVGAQLVPPGYALLLDCEVVLVNIPPQGIQAPPIGTPAPNCYQYQVFARFQFPDNSIVTSDVTNDPETSVVLLDDPVLGVPGCAFFIQKPANGQFCIPESIPDSCVAAGAGFLLRATFNAPGINTPVVQTTTCEVPFQLSTVRGFPPIPPPPPGPGGGDDSSIGLIIGAIAGVGLLGFLLAGRRKKGGHGGGGDEGPSKGGDDKGGGGDSKSDGGGGQASAGSLPSYQSVSAIRTEPPQLTVGVNQPTDMRVLVQLDGKPEWHDVTDHPDTDLSLRNPAARRVGGTVEGGREMDRYVIRRDNLDSNPLAVRASFRGVTIETPVSIDAP